MKIVISILVLAILIVTGATGYFIYGFVAQLNDPEVSKSDDPGEWQIEVSNAPEETTEPFDPEALAIDYLAEIQDYELVSVEKYSEIRTDNYFKSNKIFVFGEQGPERVFANAEDIMVKAGTLRKLIKVDQALKEEGYNLVIWIGYRDEILQQKLREHLEITMGVTEGRYDLVAAPGMSQHQKGTAVDVTLERIDGEPLEMPSAYLDFSDNRFPSLHQNNDALIALQTAMEANGMMVYNGEWWHFNDSNKEYLEDTE